MHPPLFLRDPAPPGPQVAAALLRGRGTRPVDLGDTWVIVPTSGAARCIRQHLASLTGGVLPPRFLLPMEAVLPCDGGLADATDRDLAWARVLRSGKRSRFAALVPPAVELDDPEDLLDVAGQLAGVCDTLAEAGLAPGSPEIAGARPDDTPRWEALAALHREYLAVLEEAGRPDPNGARLRQAAAPAVPPGLRRVVVACVADLPRIAQGFLDRLDEAGIPVEILVWHPGGTDGRVDAWGRPDAAWWATNPVHIPDACLVPANTADDEADALLDAVAARGSDGYAIVAAAPECLAPLSAGIARRGSVPYSPQGRPLALTEPASLLLGWDEFRRTGRLRALRCLLDLPAFLAALCGARHPLTAAGAVEACDWLMADRLCDTLAAARAWRRGAPTAARRDRERRDKLAAVFLDAVGALLRRKDGAAPWTAAGRAAEVEALAAVLEALDASALAAGEPPEVGPSLLRRAVGRAVVFDASPPGAVEIVGWLEAAWSDAPLVCVAGCREGSLPSGAAGDPFLPDSLRGALGLPERAARLARDAFLLASLLASRGPGGLVLGISRFGPGGEPNRPSRLLLACPDDDLPARVRRIFQPPAARRHTRPPAAVRLRFDVLTPPGSLSATAFRQYLRCPLRFYLARVARLETFDPDGREISAADFGSLVHAVLDRFHKQGVSDSDDDREIARFLEDELDREVARQFGPHPSPVVRAQAAFMAARLRAFAPSQAAARREGWRILETEYAVNADAGHRAGPLGLTGVIDRVEVHDDLGLRVLDYKTFGRAKTPEQTHFGSPDHGPDWAAPVARPDARGAMRTRAWTDLQLPLYRQFAAATWPEHAERGVHAGYVLLPAEESGPPFAILELDDDAMRSAMDCAAGVAGRVARGVFWPPAPVGRVDYDDFEAWFGGKDPAALIDPDTIRQLEGRP